MGESVYFRVVFVLFYDKPHQPFVVDGIKITTDVCIKHLAYLLRHDARIKGIQRPMGASPRTEAMPKTERIRLIDRI